jgi:sucrose-6-phosphate hydrolase SacC (GH32 family)
VQGPLQGHAVSRDLRKWAHLPVALWNDQPFDSVAIYTGSATVVNGTICLVYPGVCDGHRPLDNGEPTVADPVWPTCSDDDAYHYNLVVARPTDPADPLLMNWTKRLIANNTQRDPSGAWQNPDSKEWRMLTWDQVIFSSKDFLTWKKLGQPAGLPVGDCPSLFPLPRLTPGAEPAPAGAVTPDHVHKTSYNGDWYRLGTYKEGSGLSPGSWLSSGQARRQGDPWGP